MQEGIQLSKNDILKYSKTWLIQNSRDQKKNTVFFNYEEPL
jgi:hypothetical protein